MEKPDTSLAAKENIIIIYIKNSFLKLFAIGLSSEKFENRYIGNKFYFVGTNTTEWMKTIKLFSGIGRYEFPRIIAPKKEFLLFHFLNEIVHALIFKHYEY